MLITLYLLQLEKDTFVMQTVFIVVAWSLMHCCQQQNELALWILNWETNVEPQSGTMTLTGLKYTTQLWEGAFVAFVNDQLFLRLVLVGNLSGMVENCRTNNSDHLCSPWEFILFLEYKSLMDYFPCLTTAIFPHQQFIIYPFTCMLWISAIPSILQIHSSTVESAWIQNTKESKPHCVYKEMSQTCAKAQ